MTEPPRYPVTIEFDVHWAEMDAFGHVEQRALLHVVRVVPHRVISRRSGFKSDAHLPRSGPIVAHIGRRLPRLPVVFPARLVCARARAKIGNTSFSMEYGALAKRSAVGVVRAGQERDREIRLAEAFAIRQRATASLAQPQGWPNSRRPPGPTTCDAARKLDRRCDRR